jgi:Xaa-Pro aminopeptidase
MKQFPYRMAAAILMVAGFLSSPGHAPAQKSPDMKIIQNDYGVPGSAERFDLEAAIVREKLDTALLPAMRAHGIDMWLVLDRENHPDPISESLGGGSGVRTAFMFFDNGSDEPEKIYLSSHELGANTVVMQVYDVKKFYGYSKEGLAPLLHEAIAKRKPKKIGVDESITLPDADGLTVSLRDFLCQAAGPEYAKRIVSAELVLRDFRLHRTPLELASYKRLLEWSSRWMTEALSAGNVHVGTTTAMDIGWWLQDKALQEHMTGGGTPRIVRQGDLLPLDDPSITVQPGDIISIDGGLKYLFYESDIKRAVYVLKPGESEPPASIQKAWNDTLKIAELYRSKMVPGAIGHVVWEDLAKVYSKQGYSVAYPDTGARAASSTTPEVGIYGHSTGNSGHDIGARIATDWPMAYGDRVDYPLQLGEWYSQEFHVSTPIPEWGGKVWYARFEENMRVGPNGGEYIIPRQEKLLVIPAVTQ